MDKVQQNSSFCSDKFGKKLEMFILLRRIFPNRYFCIDDKEADMKFRPCIDLHDGRVKQIVGGSLSDEAGSAPQTNFDTDLPSSHFASLYKRDGLSGGHVIMLGGGNEDAALEALSEYPGGLQIGGGIRPENAAQYLDAGASHVIVTSFVFSGGRINRENLEAIKKAVGRKRLVLDLSCRKRDNEYFVMTDRWQHWTDEPLRAALFDELASHCDEFLVHAADVEGKMGGIDSELVALLGECSPIPVTYAGGVSSLDDLREVHLYGGGCVDITVGSALDIFGGNLKYDEVVTFVKTLDDTRADV